LPVEFELLSLGIILCGYKYGFTAGLILALLGGVLYTIFCTNFSPFTIPMLLGYSLMAFLSSLFPGANITLVGIIVNIAHNALVFTMYHFLFAYPFGKNIIFSASNILFNALMFLNFAPLIAGIMV
ncbi:hypothetical protein JXC34_04170, partial [Candidatus Woesearchaeota archaeon]|nr:hypothetical protein [Candidatus Woesearchaeota archaeon]